MAYTQSFLRLIRFSRPTRPAIAGLATAPPDKLGREGLPRLNSQSIAYAISRGRKSMTWGKERSTYIFFQSNKKQL